MLDSAGCGCGPVTILLEQGGDSLGQRAGLAVTE
jgi:hypothetical protein